MLDALIVGGGISGLCAARALQEHSLDWQLLESDDDFGGRIRTESIDGFRLDRGFQVLLTAYPEAQRVLKYDDLKLCRFDPGALIRTADGFTRLVDPTLQEAIQLTLFAPATAIVVVAGLARLHVEHSGVSPAGQLDDHAGGRAAEQLCGPLSWCFQLETLARGTDRDCISDFDSDFHDMAH
jgi:monoamine oxidase